MRSPVSKPTQPSKTKTTTKLTPRQLVQEQTSGQSDLIDLVPTEDTPPTTTLKEKKTADRLSQDKTASGNTSSFSPLEEIHDLESFQNVIGKLISCIVDSVNDGKSVTAANKRRIIQAAEEVRSATRILPRVLGSGETSQSSQSLSRQPDDLKQEIIAAVRQELTSFKKQMSPPQQSRPISYAQAAMAARSQPTFTPPSPPATKPAIIVSCKKDNPSSADTLASWKKNVSFRDTNFTPAGIQFVSNNKLRVEFDNPTHLETTLKKIGESHPEISAEVSKKLKPMFIIKGVSNDISPETLKELIINQNDSVNNLIKNEDDLIFKFKRPNKNEQLYNAVFLAAPYLWRVIVNLLKLNVDHQRIHVEEFTPLLQCYRCLKFGHTRKFCKSDETICSHCSDSKHEFKDCPHRKDKSKVSCHNCKIYNKKGSTESAEKSDHSAVSDSCPRKLFMIGRTRSRIDYG